MSRARPLALALSLAAAAAGCRSERDGFDSPLAEVRAAAVGAVAARRDEADAPLLLVAAQDPSPLVRKAVAGAHAARGGPRAVEALGALVADGDAEVVAAAARALSSMPSDRRVPLLLADAFWRVPGAARAEIASAIEATGGSLQEAVALEARAAWDRNVAALERGAGAAERAGAAEELGRSGRSEAVHLLAPLLEAYRREEPRVVAAAARGLGATGDASARPALEALLEESGDAALAEAAAEALGTLGDPAAAPALAQAAASGPSRLSAAALEALARLPLAPAVALAACQLALHASDPEVAKKAAAQARVREGECPHRPFLARLARRGLDALATLGALSDLRLTPDAAEDAAGRILPLLKSGEPSVRIAAARALGRLGSGRAALAVARRAGEVGARLDAARRRSSGQSEVDGADAQELGALLSALSQLEHDRLVEIAGARLGDPSEVVRAAAVDALAALGRGEVARIAAALADPAQRVRVTAASALGRIGPSAATVLARAAEAADLRDAAWCAAIARALGETGSPEAVPALVRLAASPCAPASAAALGRIGTRDATAALVDLLRRPALSGRAEAIEALGALEADGAGPALVTELASDRAELRAAAARALGRIRHQGAGSRLEALRSDYDAGVRRAAVEALAKLPARGGR